MIVQGQIQNGVVVFDPAVRLPDGQRVTVIVPSMTNDPGHSILDIPKISLGSLVSPMTSHVDLLGEMLADRS